MSETRLNRAQAARQERTRVEDLEQVRVKERRHKNKMSTWEENNKRH